jgi:7,8-dihydropterin-6-yl-methyl-4-(beta-D-ribofuranosyl)aminobenzene 5'-phosphate synthase
VPRRLASLSLLALALAVSAIAGDPAARITILYDNSIARPDVKAAWGFACLVETHGRTILFDTGGDPAVIKDNLAALKVDASRIQAVVVSHFHGDHTLGASGSAVPKGTSVYTPHSFAPYGQVMTALTGAGLVPVAVAEPKALFEGLTISAPMPFPGRQISATGAASIDKSWEEALLVDTPRGLVVLVGCSHPGIVPMLEQVKKSTGKPIHMVVGGFHLLQKPLAEVRTIAAAVKSLGVAHAGPTHCTGDDGIFAFRELYGDAFVPGGVGQVIEIAAEPVAIPQ